MCVPRGFAGVCGRGSHSIGGHLERITRNNTIHRLPCFIFLARRDMCHVRRRGYVAYRVREGLSCTGSRRVSSKVSRRDQDRLRFGLARPGYFVHKLDYTCETRIYQIYNIMIDVAVSNIDRQSSEGHALCGQLPALSARRLEPPSTVQDTRRRHNTSLSSPIVNLSNDQTIICWHTTTTKRPFSCLRLCNREHWSPSVCSVILTCS